MFHNGSDGVKLSQYNAGHNKEPSCR